MSTPAAPDETPRIPEFAPGAAPDGGTAADRLREVAGRASSEFRKVVDEHPALDRVPGRSLTLVGVGLVAAAIALSMLPWFSGIGVVWSAVMLAAGAVVAIGELTGAGVDVPRQRLPEPLRHPVIAPAFAALVVLHAFLLLTIGIVPLVWVAAAVLLGYDQYRRAARAPDGFVHRFDVRRAWQGYRRNVTAGVGACLASLFLTWGRSSGYFSGGLSYNYAYRYDSSSGTSGYAYDYDYNPTQYYWPGWETSGRSQSFAMLAVALLLGLVLWASLRPGEGAGRRVASAGLGMGGALAAFWLLASKDGAGALVFLLGLGMILFAAFRIHRGEDAGRWDLEHATAAVRARMRGRARPSGQV